MAAMISRTTAGIGEVCAYVTNWHLLLIWRDAKVGDMKRNCQCLFFSLQQTHLHLLSPSNCACHLAYLWTTFVVIKILDHPLKYCYSLQQY